MPCYSPTEYRRMPVLLGTASGRADEHLAGSAVRRDRRDESDLAPVPARELVACTFDKPRRPAKISAGSAELCASPA
jgi:hypothetical protein